MMRGLRPIEENAGCGMGNAECGVRNAERCPELVEGCGVRMWLKLEREQLGMRRHFLRRR